MTHVVTIMCWPVLVTQFWLEMTTNMLRCQAETDRGDNEGQLPVPDAIQDSMDSEIFA